MANFKDVLRVLFERWKLARGGGNQEEFADSHDVKRETMNLWLNGKNRPPLSTVKRILSEEGFDIYDCFDLPEAEARKAEYRSLYAHLNKLVLINDTDRLTSLSFILGDMAAAAKPSSTKVVPIESATTEESGQLRPNVKKKLPGKNPRAS